MYNFEQEHEPVDFDAQLERLDPDELGPEIDLEGDRDSDERGNREVQP